MLDEKFIPSQFNEGKDFMAKASVVFEDSISEYTTKKKDKSKARYKLINPPKIKQIDKLKINANKIIFPTDTKTNKYLNNFYNTGLNPFDYVQKENSYL